MKTYDVFRNVKSDLDRSDHVGTVEAGNMAEALEIALEKFDCPRTSQLWVDEVTDESV